MPKVAQMLERIVRNGRLIANKKNETQKYRYSEKKKLFELLYDAHRVACLPSPDLCLRFGCLSPIKGNFDPATMGEKETAESQQKRMEETLKSSPTKDTPNTRLQRALEDQRFMYKLRAAFPNHANIFDAQIVHPKKHDIEIFCGCKMELDKSEHTVEVSHSGITWSVRLCHTILRLIDACDDEKFAQTSTTTDL
jgi:hypothetical protein